MIASVRGSVLSLQLDSVVIEVGGVGLLMQATPATLSGLRVGQSAQLFTSLIVREDSLTLFAFADADERDTFETVQTVSGIGPRLAQAMLAVHTPDGLRAAVAANDLKALTKVPGIGQKGAQRIVLELTDRLGAPSGAAASVASSPAASSAAWRDQVVSALVGLGWNAKVATEAVEAVASEGNDPDAATGEAPDVAAVLRASLRHLGRS